MIELVLTIIGRDRAGVVAELADVVRFHEANWKRSELAEISGTFAGVVVVDVDDDRADELLTNLLILRQQGLHITAEQIEAPVEAPDAQPVRLRFTGDDRPGIVHEISTTISGFGISIARLGTAHRHRPATPISSRSPPSWSCPSPSTSTPCSTQSAPSRAIWASPCTSKTSPATPTTSAAVKRRVSPPPAVAETLRFGPLASSCQMRGQTRSRRPAGAGRLDLRWGVSEMNESPGQTGGDRPSRRGSHTQIGACSHGIAASVRIVANAGRHLREAHIAGTRHPSPALSPEDSSASRTSDGPAPPGFQAFRACPVGRAHTCRYAWPGTRTRRPAEPDASCS